jgi:hypothetical protein
VAVLPDNTMLGPYRIAGLLGEGGMGAVYRAQDTRLGRNVAIKILTNVTLSDRERLIRFEQEARATGMLNHPNLLTIYDIGHAQGTPYLVSELLEGETLRDRLNKGPMPPRKAIEVALGMAHGLAAAHEKAIVHRDLKPENIFITRDNRVKILDFGIAKLTAGGGEGPKFQMAATEPGMVMGTVGYMSPEQVRGETVDQRSDIFAFGAILYEMLTGNRAFKRDSSIETLSAILKEEPADIEAMPGVPPALERLLRRCLEKDRAQRFQSARDLAFNLETLSTYSSAASVTKVPVPASAARPEPTLAPTVTMRQPVRPKTQTQVPVPKPQAKPKVSPVLLALLFVVAIGGAVYGGWYLATRKAEKVEEIAFRRATFRRGEVRGARFTSDGDTIVYSAAWDGRPAEIFVASRQSPEARPLGVADADILAVSKSTELAILLRRDRLTSLGTLARVSMAGGMPREIAENVLHADWSPDGSQLAVIRFARNSWRVEYPVGNIKYQTLHYVRDMRISPDGTRVAFIEPHGGEYDIVVTGPDGTQPIARGWSRGVNGLAWSPDGKEVWITGTSTSAPPSLYAIPLEGEPRLVSRLTGSMKLFDISEQRRVLLSNGTWRAALLYQAPGTRAERDMSWLDWSVLADLSVDGRTLLFNETREGGGGRSSIYLRHEDAPAPVRIGDGTGDALSPDKKWVLSHSGTKLVLLPTGTGETRELKIAGTFALGAAWLPDSRRVIIGGGLPPKGDYRLLLIDTQAESVLPLSPENIWGSAYRPFAISPDGNFVAGMNAEEMIVIYPTDGSGTATSVPGVEKGEVPIQWTSDGAALYVYRPTALPARVYKVTLVNGARELWKEFAPADPAGVYRISPVFMTPDASGYAYNALRTVSDLYIAEGLR